MEEKLEELKQKRRIFQKQDKELRLLQAKLEKELKKEQGIKGLFNKLRK